MREAQRIGQGFPNPTRNPNSKKGGSPERSFPKGRFNTQCRTVQVRGEARRGEKQECQVRHGVRRLGAAFPHGGLARSGSSGGAKTHCRAPLRHRGMPRRGKAVASHRTPCAGPRQ
jgi:hypothetical protein